jgi:hypothetical protein
MSRAVERRLVRLEGRGEWWQLKFAAGTLAPPDLRKMRDSELDALCVTMIGKPLPPRPGISPKARAAWPREMWDGDCCPKNVRPIANTADAETLAALAAALAAEYHLRVSVR